jgi:hypothetical protein
MQALMLRLLTAAAASLAMALAAVAPAHADGFGDVNCTLDPDLPQCVVTVTYTGGGSGTGGGGGNVVCKIGGNIVDCHNAFGWLGSDGCYYGKDGGGFLPANQWIKICLDPATGDPIPGFTIVTLPRPPAALGVITQRAVDNLTMSRPVIAANPALTTKQFVHVPVWWWVQPGWWQTQNARASAGGLTITAKAVPRKITWYAGDGTSTVCTGPGTPWTTSVDPIAASPTCGHTYTTTSANSPRGRFTVRAVATWDVSWSGGGLSGTEPAITTTTTVTVTVAEQRAVITR